MKKPGKTKTLPCRECGEKVENVGDDAVAVTCFRCVNRSMIIGGSLNLSDTDNEEDQDN